jgi:putative membrane protein
MSEKNLPMVVPDLPAELSQAIEGKDSGTTSTLLGIYRTRLAVRRTGLADLRSHLANERTHLAYIRTSISLISFGITLNRFSVFLQQQGTLKVGEGTGHLLRDTRSVGWGMVILGIALAIWALYRYWHVNRSICKGVFEPLDRAVIAMTLLLILLGGASALWMI